MSAKRADKWDVNWDDGIWLGKTDASDEHLLYINGMIKTVRSIRRFAKGDGRRWQVKMLQEMKAVPWSTKDAGVTKAEVEKAMVKHMAEARAMPIMPKRMRPKTLGCAACAVRGSNGKPPARASACSDLR